MTHIQNILAQPACQALGWALLHFLWQGTLAALLLAACNRALRDSPARARYAVSCLFLLVLLALPVLTFTASLAHAPALPVTPDAFSAPAPAPTRIVAAISAPVIPRSSLQDSLTPFLPWIVALWIAGVVLVSMRWIGAWAYLHRLRRAPGLPIPPDWERALRDLLRRAAVSAPVRLSIHRLTQVPCVIGWLRPVILMPAASLASLDWRAFEALLAHEIAHIRRRDYLVNLLQTTVDTLLFYHPAVWWVSRQIRIERENCCDDFAARLCGGRVAYARALVDLEHIRAAEPAFAMSARGGSLLHRIQRLLSPGDAERRGPAWPAALAGIAVVACLMVALHPPVRAQRAAQPADSHDFLTGIVAAGFRNLTVDELIDLKIHGVTPEFALAVKQSGFTNVTAHELVDMAIHGVDANFMREMKNAGLANLSVADLVSLRIHGVDAAFIRHLNESGIKNLSVEQLLRLKRSGL
jgi:beta-lactamase regulating signal transducer with metallopeptidase domain